MNRKIIYIYNPISGTKSKDGILKKIEIETKAKNFSFQFCIANSEGNYEQLKNKIENEKITDVVIIGGDGTVNQITGALKNCNVQFGIIPAGSGNGLAYAAGIPKNINSALNIIFTKNAQKTDAFLVNNFYACMLSGLGFDALIAHKFATHTKRGLITYIQQSVLHFFKATTYPFEVLMDGNSFFTDAYFISIANSNQFGNNVTIAPKARLNDGLLDIVIVQKMHKAKLVFAVIKQILGNNNVQLFSKNNSDTGILYFQTDALSIKNLKLAPLHIDGDPYETTDVFNIEIIKDCFELIRP